MSEHFLGLTMLVTLNSPPKAQLRGKVSSVIAGQSLTLRDVVCPGNGRRITEITIKASDIVDLVEATDENVAPRPIQHSPVVPMAPRPKTFEDPAIVSMGRRPAAYTPSPGPLRFEISADEAIRPPEISHRVPHKDIPASTPLVEPLGKIEINGQEEEIGNTSDATQQANQAKRSKRGARRKQRKAMKQSTDLADLDESLPAVIPVTETNRAKGWRQTPLLEPNPSFQPFSTLRKKTRKADKGYDNGWATEDATDVQDMGDFDFESNLSKFDKRTVFEGIKAEDMTADEDRLVGHNRLPKPGTAGGKNLHHTENVLDLANGKPQWNSEAGDSDEVLDAVSQKGSGSGRTSRRGESRRGESRLRNSVSRKDSLAKPPQMARSHSSTAQVTSVPANSRSAFYLVPADRRCEVASPLQMLNLENIVNSELGLTEDMMTENAARGIAEVALSALNTGGRRLTQGSNNTLPYVVVYAGNNKSGQRAVGAGRHLRNHGVNVVVCVLGLEREPELLEGFRRQLKAFRSFGGKVFTKVELLDFIKSLDVPVELIIDGLLGLTISFEELRTGDQATAYELILWANRSQANVLAIDIPTGIDPTSGKVSIIDGAPVYIQAQFVVAMGAPKKGLLQVMSLGEGVSENGPWQLFVADIGIANQAWKRAGTRMRRGVEFEGTWVLGMRFQKGDN